MTAKKSDSDKAAGGKDNGAKPNDANWAFDEDGLLAAMVAKAGNDAAAPFEMVADLADLRKASRADYERVIEALKASGFGRLTELEKEVRRLGAGKDDAPEDLEVIEEIVKEDCLLLFHNEEKHAFADVRARSGNRATMAINGPDFRHWLRGRFYEQTNRGLRSDSYETAKATIEARAIYGGPQHEVFLRVAGLQLRSPKDGHAAPVDCLYLDIGSETYEAIEIDADGWRIVAEPSVRFYRSRRTRALPMPVAGGHIDELRPFVSLKEEDDFRLLCSFFVDVCRMSKTYPILLVNGLQGATKTSLFRVMKHIVDPTHPELRSSLPSEQREYAIMGTAMHLLAFDNVSTLSDPQCDYLSTMSTGAGFSTRALYTNNDDWAYEGARPQALNGIPDFATQPDLIDRVVAITCVKPTESIPEDVFWLEFDAARPRILGAVLDSLSRGLKRLPGITTRNLPRMADFTRWAMACAPGFGWSEDDFLAAYSGATSGILNKLIDDDPLANAIDDLLQGRRKWSGTATQLLKLINENAEPSTKREKGWPKAPNQLSNLLKRHALALQRVLSIAVDLGNRKGHLRDRKIMLARILSNTDDRADATNSRAKGANGSANAADPGHDPSSAFNHMKSKEKNGSQDADDGSLHPSDPEKNGTPPKGRHKSSKPLKKKQFSDFTEEKF